MQFERQEPLAAPRGISIELTPPAPGWCPVLAIRWPNHLDSRSLKRATATSGEFLHKGEFKAGRGGEVRVAVRTFEG